MKKLNYLCLSLITLLFACTTKNKSNQTNNAENNNVLEVELFTENVILPEDIIDQDNDYQFVYSLKQNDSTFIGDVYAKFENDTLFGYLYVINNQDTIYSIKKNQFFNKDGILDAKTRNDIYGYSFLIKGNDYFLIYLWDSYGDPLTEFPSLVEWNYDENMIRSVHP